MYDFNKYLGTNEKILWQGKPNLGKGSKNVGGEIFGIIFVLLSIFIYIIENEPNIVKWILVILLMLLKMV